MIDSCGAVHSYHDVEIWYIVNMRRWFINQVSYWWVLLNNTNRLVLTSFWNSNPLKIYKYICYQILQMKYCFDVYGWLVGWLVSWSVGRSVGRSVGWTKSCSCAMCVNVMVSSTFIDEQVLMFRGLLNFPMQVMLPGDIF